MTDDDHPGRTPLRLPAPPGLSGKPSGVGGGRGDAAWEQGRGARTGAAVYPRIPSVPGVGGRGGSGSSWDRGGTARDPRPRVAVVAATAGLLGALLGSGAAVMVLDSRQPVPVVAEPAVERTAPTPASPEPTREPVAEMPPDRVAEVARAVLPTVVQIDIDGGGPLGDGSGNGSGVVYRSDGYIITNNHVVAGGGDLSVVFADGSRSDAEVVGTDRESDVAVLRVDRAGLEAIDLGDSDAIEVGELAVAIGSPFGLEGSVTAGIVSAVNRPIVVAGADGQPVQLPSVIQTDAPINPGNSGGALVSGEGRLIGINSAILTSGTPANAGVGFAIPVNIVVAVAEDLIADGFVRYPLIGVVGQPVTPEIAARLGVDAGALVTEIAPDTPAADAGLQPDDVIIAIDEQPIGSFSDLVVAVRRFDVGDTITVRYVRDGEEDTVDVTLVERPR